MSDGFRNNDVAVAGVVNSLQSVASNYRSCVLELDNLLSSIYTSAEWIDENVKTSFLNTCSAYLGMFEALADSMDVYIEYISSASNRASEIESHYAG